jgi:hypothetical protein
MKEMSGQEEGKEDASGLYSIHCIATLGQGQLEPCLLFAGVRSVSTLCIGPWGRFSANLVWLFIDRDKV